MPRSEWVMPSRTLVCAACGQMLGRASLNGTGELLVSDRADHAVSAARGNDLLDKAKAMVRHFADAAQTVALDHELRDREPVKWNADLASAEGAVKACLAEVSRLRGAADEITYAFRCNGGHGPRISAARLAAELRDTPGGRLLLE